MKKQKKVSKFIRVKFTLLFCLGVIMSLNLYAQDKQVNVTGTVTDPAGEPIIGTSVTVKNRAGVGTITDYDGNFSLKASTNETLVISFVGYLTQEIAIGNKTTFKVELKEDSEILEEVVVVGYGAQKKISVTGAVASINSTVLKQTPVANLSNALAGKITGLMAVQRSGEPGYDSSNLWVRGMGTYTGSTTPLILVDGTERSFGDLDPNEIENISILKDASATAVYGVRGANGVIVVTTKRGEAGKPRITMNLQHGILEPTRLGEYLNSYDALTLYQEGLINDGKSIAQYTDEYIAKFKDRSNPTYQYLYPDVNWLDEMLKSHTSQTQANINISGGGDTFRYFVSLSYLNQDGIYKNTDMGDYDVNVNSKRYNFRSNIDLNITNNVILEMNLAGIMMDNNYPGTGAPDIFRSAKQVPSYWYPKTNPDGSIAEVLGMEANPYAMLTQKGYATENRATLNATVGVTWKLDFLTKGLSFKAKATFDTYNYKNIGRRKNYKSFAYSIDENETDLDKGVYSSVSQADEIMGYDVSANGSRYTVFEVMFNYARSFGKHDFGGLLLYNQHQENKAVDPESLM